ncbi:MAG: hypothetical protein AB1422_09910 [bacterium]
MIKLNQDLVEKLKKQLERGNQLLQSGTFNLNEISKWESMTGNYVHSLDPAGSCITYGTPYCIWDHAQYFKGNTPKNKSERITVFQQRIGALEIILSSEIKLAQVKYHERDYIEKKCPFHIRRIDECNNLIFVLMPFSTNWSERVWKKHIRPSVTGLDLTPPLICQRADDLCGQDVMIDIYESIVKAKIIIADITGQNPNVFYELGIAHTLGKRVILITQDVKEIPFDLLRFRHIIYSDNSEGCEKLKETLKKYIYDIIKEDEPNFD